MSAFGNFFLHQAARNLRSSTMPRAPLPVLTLLVLTLIAAPLVPVSAADATAGMHDAGMLVQPRAAPLLANFTWTPVSPFAGELVRFNDTSSGNPAWWEWDSGDGTPGSTDQNPTHTLRHSGELHGPAERLLSEQRDRPRRLPGDRRHPRGSPSSPARRFSRRTRTTTGRTTT